MGSRRRSIRLRIYFLVAIPLITMLGLFGFVAYTSVTNFQNLDRAPGLVEATTIPTSTFFGELQEERRFAVVYASAPTAANLATYKHWIGVASAGLVAARGVANSPATTDNATPAETAAFAKLFQEAAGLTSVRTEVTDKKLDPLATFTAYTTVIANQQTIFQAEASSMADTVASQQGLAAIAATDAREDLSQQDALLAGALAGGSLPPTEQAAFSTAYGEQLDSTTLYESLFSPQVLAQFNQTVSQSLKKLAPGVAVQDDITKVQQAVVDGIPLSEIEAVGGLNSTTWFDLTGAMEEADAAGATSSAQALVTTVQGLSNDAKNRIYETGGGGLLGLLLTVLVTLLLGRSINQRLTTLRRSALTLAQEQLPSVVSRLRRGESVDVATEAPPLRVGDDEIGEVGEAFDAVRQTAIRSAIDEAGVRQGVNDMFRNLARRNQSLIQRQLTVLDEAEHRATDPEVLDDLFKMDHLTTRMRRHAEGLIILSGSAPGRSWSQPVKLIDVMRGAVAEVEDYARAIVTTTSTASLVGSAVTDVVHLLAELIENATQLSPPDTQVRVGGETVANGFAIEIEDRGLGLNPQRLQELNQRLASPPEINPANTEQLGLFVVAQLARRHGLQVMLRPGTYGGTTAIVLIPTALIVEAGTPALPMRSDSAAANGQPNDLGGRDARGSRRPGEGWRNTSSAPGRGNGSGPNELPGRQPVRSDGPTPIATAAAAAVAGNRRGRHSDEDVPVVTGVPVSRAETLQPQDEFDAFRPLRRAEQEGTASFNTPATSQQSYPDFASRQDSGKYVSPYADPRSPNYQGDGNPYIAPSSPGNAGNIGNRGNSGAGRRDKEEMNNGGTTSEGLPIRVRQANLAPQLRASAKANAQGNASAVPRASAASLDDMRSTLSAMQRGWQQGRSQTQRDSKGSGDGQ